MRGRISVFERPREDAPSKCRIPRRSRGSDRQKSHECGGLFNKSIAPIGGEPTDSRAGLGFQSATGHLGGKHCANSEAPCGVAAAHGLRRLAAAVAVGPGWNRALHRIVTTGPGV